MNITMLDHVNSLSYMECITWCDTELSNYQSPACTCGSHSSLAAVSVSSRVLPPRFSDHSSEQNQST